MTKEYFAVDITVSAITVSDYEEFNSEWEKLLRRFTKGGSSLSIRPPSLGTRLHSGERFSGDSYVPIAEDSL